MRAVFRACVLVAGLAHLVQPARGATLCVNPGGTGGCYGLIQDAIDAAASGDTIAIAAAASPYVEHLTISDKSLTLHGSSPDTTILDGGAAGQVLRILGMSTPVRTVVLENLTIQNGQAGLPDPNGVGIKDIDCNLSLSHVVVRNNHTLASGDGGGIFVSGSPGLVLTVGLTDSTVTGNTTGAGRAGASGGNGAGIFVTGDSVALNLLRSTVSGNTTGSGVDNPFGDAGNGGDGGGIYSFGCGVSVVDSTISGNSTGTGGSGLTANGRSGNGAGIFLDTSCGPNSIVNSTVSGNQTGLGGGTGVGGGVFQPLGVAPSFQSSTVVLNREYGVISGGTVQNSILMFNSPLDCSGTLTSLGHNLFEHLTSCPIFRAPSDVLAAAVALSALQDNGGPTQTHALLEPTPPDINQAIDAGDDSTCPFTDQRGERRPSGAHCDVGAFELQVGLDFYTLPPCRVFDTRNSSGPDAAAPPLAAKETRPLSLSGRCGIPDDAVAISANLTVTQPAAGGYLTVFRGELDQPPVTSNLNFGPGGTRANNAVLELARDRTVTLKFLNGSPGTLQFILDVNGYFK